MRNADRRYKAVIVFLVIATISWVCFLGVQAHSCSEEGGLYVRGLWGMECVDKGEP